MKKRAMLAKQFGLPAMIAAVIAVAVFYPRRPRRDPLVLDDVSRLNQTRVSEILRPRTEEELRQAILRAKQLGLKVSISGKKHSQGGHAFYANAVHLDMTQFNTNKGKRRVFSCKNSCM